MMRWQALKAIYLRDGDDRSLASGAGPLVVGSTFIAETRCPDEAINEWPLYPNACETVAP